MTSGCKQPVTFHDKLKFSEALLSRVYEIHSYLGHGLSLLCCYHPILLIRDITSASSSEVASYIA